MVHSYSAEQYYFLLTFVGVATATSLYLAFRSFKRARLIEDTPTSKIRSAPQGHVEFEGVARNLDGPPVFAPLTSTRCCWYSYKVEKYTRSANNKSSSWRTTESGVSDDLFYIVDDTGQCIVDPDGAHVTCDTQEVWYGDTPRPKFAGAVKSKSMAVKIANVLMSVPYTDRYRYTERRIHLGESLYAIGRYESIRADLQGNINQDVAHRLRELKRNPQQLAAHDINQDGEIDMQEWEQARVAVRKQGYKEQLKTPQIQEANVLKNTNDASRPYVISTKQQSKIIHTHKISMRVFLILFIGLCVLLIWFFCAKQMKANKKIKLTTLLIAVNLTSIATGFAQETAHVTDLLQLRVYASPDNSSQVVQTIESGDAVQIVGKQGDFTKIIRLEGATGWVKHLFLCKRLQRDCCIFRYPKNMTN